MKILHKKDHMNQTKKSIIVNTKISNKNQVHDNMSDKNISKIKLITRRRKDSGANKSKGIPNTHRRLCLSSFGSRLGLTWRGENRQS